MGSGPPIFAAAPAASERNRHQLGVFTMIARTRLFLSAASFAVLATTACSDAGTNPSQIAPLSGIRASGGASGTGGGGKTPAVAMPADWPTAVAVPPGQLYGVSAGAKDPQWVLGLIGQGDAAQYIASVDALYTQAGYTLVGGSPYVLTNVTFTITVAMQPNDHSATTTIVAFQLHRN